MAIKTAPVSLARLQEGIYYLENIEKEKKNLPKGGRQKLSSGFCPLGGYPLADFPAVFFHISHWYLSWNTAGGGNCI